MSNSSPMFTLVTPTLQRPSLLRCCESVNEQTYANGWQHVIMVDCAEWDTELLKQIEHPQRRIIKCPVPHGHYGNKCRHNAWEFATGEWIWYLDDDNYIADDKVLEDIATALADIPQLWAIFPIHRHGRPFFYDPPGSCYVDTMNVVFSREIGRWPDIEAREADGYIVDVLKKKYHYAAFPNFRPIGIMEKSSNGV